MNWINCKDRLPDNQCIAIGYQNEIIIGWVYEITEGPNVGSFNCENDNEVLVAVTHWMNLPEPPKP